jgi:hypothetical protein
MIYQFTLKSTNGRRRLLIKPWGSFSKRFGVTLIN